MARVTRVIRAASDKHAKPAQYEIKNGRVFIYRGGLLQSHYPDTPEMRQWCEDHHFVNRYSQ